MENVLFVVLALFLVVLNGFFVAAEFGIVTLRKSRVQAIAKTAGLRGRILAKVHGQLDAYLSACQLGITLASLGLGWVGEPAFARLLEPVFAFVGVESEQLIHGISFIVAFSVISYLHIVVGELAPKSMALRVPEAVSLWCAPPLYAFYWLMYPAIALLNASANLILKWFGLAGAGHEAHYSTEELKFILRTSTPGEKFTNDERQILAQSLDFSQLAVSDLMRPINEVVALHANRSLEENMQTVLRNRFSRYPYFDEEGEEVLGLIHLKDLFFAEQSGREITDLKEFLRPVETISARTPAQQIFRRFRGGAPHFAMIGEKGKRPVGFITLDNLLGAMVGEIRDEFRPTSENEWLQQGDGTLIGKASLPIFSLERSLGIDIDNEEMGLDEVESVGGLLMAKLGDIPRQGQRIEFPQFDVVVKKMKGPRIMLVKVIPQLEREGNPDDLD